MLAWRGVEVERALGRTYHDLKKCTPRLMVLLHMRRLNLLEKYDLIG